MHSSGLVDERLSVQVETTLYRIAQEALTNVAKHARATQVQVILERRGTVVVLAIEDNGIGFDPESEPSIDDASQSRSFGLLGMYERAALIGASLTIESSPGQGTTILLRMTADVQTSPIHG
jgi:signal transduction histidine kinase